MLRAVIAVVAGILVGSLINAGLIALGMAVVPTSAGVDLSNPEGWRAALPLLGPQHFVAPFLAHALGTLIGTGLASRIAPDTRVLVSVIVGGVFLLGGVAAARMIPAPTWFIALDLLVAYVPMAWLGSQRVYR